MPEDAKPAEPPPKPLTRAEAQRQLGLFAPHDYVTMGILIFSWVTMAFWKIFGDPTVLNLICCVLFDIFVMLIWMTLLIYRVLVFVLDLHSDVALMPEAAARMAVGFFEGRRPSAAAARAR